MIKRTEQFSKLVEDFFNKGLFTHCFAASGHLDSPTPVFHHSFSKDDKNIFDLASLTKLFVTAPLVYKAAMERGVSLDTSLRNFLGEDKVSGLSETLSNLSLMKLLSHTSGLPSWRNFYVCQLEDLGCCYDSKGYESHRLKVLNQSAKDLGEQGIDRYSDVGYILLGACLEKFYGRSLSVLFSSFCYEELKFKENEFGFCENIVKKDRIISSGYCEVRKQTLANGLVHDENAHMFNGISGHAGLFSSGLILVKFLSKLFCAKLGQQLLNDNVKILSSNSRGALLGFRHGDSSSLKHFCDGHSIGHFGFTGTSFWLCPASRSYHLLLTNRTISERRPKLIHGFRKAAYQILSN